MQRMTSTQPRRPAPARCPDSRARAFPALRSAFAAGWRPCLLAAAILLAGCCLSACRAASEKPDENPGRTERPAGSSGGSGTKTGTGETPEPGEDARRSLQRVEMGLEMPQLIPGAAVPETFRTIPGRDYKVAAHDKLEVSILSAHPEKQECMVSPDGSIVLPLVGAVPCSGKSVAELEKALTTSYKRYLKQFTLTVTVTDLHGIEVTVAGNVKKPGPYSVAGLTRLWEALQRAGGITSAGSIRNIEVRRADGSRRTVDLYPFLFEGKEEPNIVLQPEDMITVPVAERVVGLAGEVRRPALYEFRKGESLAGLLALAGGATAFAALDKAYVERPLPDQTKKLLHMDLRSPAAADGEQLQDGDTLVVPPMAVFLGSVHADGQVRQPGKYERKANMRLADLVNLAGGMTAQAAPTRAYVERVEGYEKPRTLFVDAEAALRGDAKANIPLMDGDTLFVPNIATFAGTVTVRGEVRQPLQHTLTDGMTVRDLLELAGGVTPGAATKYARVERLDPGREARRIVWVDVAKALQGDRKSNVRLQEGDVLVVEPSSLYFGRVTASGELRAVEQAAAAARARKQFAAAGPDQGGDQQTGRAKDDATQKTAGSEDVAGETTVDLTEGMRISDLVRLCGNPTASAALEQARLTRIGAGGMKEAVRVDLRAVLAKPGSAADLALQDGDDLYVPSIKVLQKTVRVVGEVMGTGIFETQTTATGEKQVKRRGLYELKEGDTVRDLVLAVGGVTANASLRGARIDRQGPDGKTQHIPVDLYQLLIQKDEKANVALKNGDEFVVPSLAEMVYVVGAVNQPGAYPYQEGNNRVLDMIARAGGVTPRAKLPDVLLVRAERGPKDPPTKLNMEAVMKRGRLDLDPGVRAGDVVVVPEHIVTFPDVLQLLANISMLRVYATGW